MSGLISKVNVTMCVCKPSLILNSPLHSFTPNHTNVPNTIFTTYICNGDVRVGEGAR